MKFVYPYKFDHSTLELELSIKMVYHAYPDAEVYIIGDAPDISLPYVHIPYTSYLKHAGCEVTDKVMRFCELIGDEFILMNDDFFITAKFPIYQVMRNGYLTINPHYSIYYQQACENTIDWLTANHLELINYECHQPVYIQSCKFIELFRDIDYKSHNHLLKSIYFNTWPQQSYQGENLKFQYSFNKAKKCLEKYGAFSSSEDFFNPDILQFFNKYLSSAVQPPSAGCQ